MTDLINKTLVTSTGITLCKPDIYSLDILTDERGNKALCLLHMGSNIVQFDVNDDVRKKLVELLSTPIDWEELLDQRAREVEALNKTWLQRSGREEEGLPIDNDSQ